MYSVEEVDTLRYVVLMLQRKNGMKLPSTAEEWDMTPCCDLDVRRSHMVVDGVRAAKKTQFNCTNLLRVCLISVTVKYTKSSCCCWTFYNNFTGSLC